MTSDIQKSKNKQAWILSTEKLFTFIFPSLRRGLFWCKASKIATSAVPFSKRDFFCKICWEGLFFRQAKGVTVAINGLRIFSAPDGLPQEEADQMDVLRSRVISKVVCYALGPKGTNIEQATEEWLRRLRITDKAETYLCGTPEECLGAARQTTEDSVVAVYVTCAVYAHESRFFFRNPDIYPFFSKGTMLLDRMQLATRPEMVASIMNGNIPKSWTISSHPSPQYLVEDLGCNIIIVDSNAAAAEHCREGSSYACITTEAARKRCGLVALHEFGSPVMVFFFGITEHGAEIIRRVFKAVLVDRADFTRQCMV